MRARAKRPVIDIPVNGHDGGAGHFTAEELNACGHVFFEAARALENGGHGTVICEVSGKILCAVSIDRGKDFPFSVEDGLPVLKQVKL